jgi:hypothetical protein
MKGKVYNVRFVDLPVIDKGSRIFRTPGIHALPGKQK